MTPESRANLLLKAFGLYALLQTIEYLPTLVYHLTNISRGTTDMAHHAVATAYILLFCLLAVVSVGLLFFTDKFTWLFVEKMIEGTPTSTLPSGEWERVLFSGFGLYLLAQTVPHISRLLSQMILPVYERPRWTDDALSATLTIAVGAALLLRSKGLVDLLDRFRNWR